MNFSHSQWLTDNGINLPMLNDVPRNKFYDSILADSVRGKKCCEVGFGTGLLSLLALKHGANHIIAYEQDLQRFKFGIYVIDQLNLTTKIDLRNEQANSEILHNINCDLVFHEILHQDIWGEGVWWIRPTDISKTFLPGRFFFELWIQEFAESAIQGLGNGFDIRDYFCPGVDIDSSFINLINQHILGDQSKDINQLSQINSLTKLSLNQMHKDWSWNVAQVFHQCPKVVAAGYVTDYNTLMMHRMDKRGNHIINLDHQVRLEIDLSAYRHKNVLIRPRFGIEHAHSRLYLDQCRNWGTEPLWLYSQIENDLIFDQDFSTPAYSLTQDQC